MKVPASLKTDIGNSKRAIINKTILISTIQTTSKYRIAKMGKKRQQYQFGRKNVRNEYQIPVNPNNYKNRLFRYKDPLK